MTTLEATVEIVKSAIATSNVSYEFIVHTKSRKEFIDGIEEIYKKIKELNKDNLNN